MAKYKYDARFKRLSQNPGFVIINNYKCGFSSSNLLEARQLVRLSSEDKIVFFYRNIFSRAVSVFINWCITDDRYKYSGGWLLNNISEFLGDSEYEYFIGLFYEDAIAEAFTIYAEVLEHIYQKDNHTLPQTQILDHYGIENVHYHVDLDKSEQFFTITNVPFPFDKKNASDRNIKQRLLRCVYDSRRLRVKLRKVYSADVSYFGAKNIIVDGVSW